MLFNLSKGTSVIAVCACVLQDCAERDVLVCTCVIIVNGTPEINAIILMDRWMGECVR